tara:strand:- start:339 stop:554 length:216 start_codon:yes stop_codon:yes gene_type:complete
MSKSILEVGNLVTYNVEYGVQHSERLRNQNMLDDYGIIIEKGIFTGYNDVKVLWNNRVATAKSAALMRACE